MKIRPPEISAQAHEMIMAIASKRGWTFSDALDYVCNNHSEPLWERAGIVARQNQDVGHARDELVNEVDDE